MRVQARPPLPVCSPGKSALAGFSGKTIKSAKLTRLRQHNSPSSQPRPLGTLANRIISEITA